MKIKRFKLSDDVTREKLIELGAREGGTWVKDDAELFLSKDVYYKPFDFEFSIDIAFTSNIHNWNDFDNVLVIDDDFGQPYTPFYHDNYGKDITGFPALELVIKTYNEYLSSLGIFEEV